MNLKHCPFCGGKDLGIEKFNPPNPLYCVICENCHSEGPTGKDKEQAKRKWNKRFSAKIKTIQKS